jgi:hypothetical protein
VTVLFADGLPEIFTALPEGAKRKAARSIDLAPRPDASYRYLIADRFLFYYSVSSIEIRIAATIPAAMRQA